jgi:hypothetical protein
MRLKNFIKISTFFAGFLVGRLLHPSLEPNHAVEPTTTTTAQSTQLYNSTLADFLHDNVRILCWVFTHPSNHKTKVPHVRETWARKCSKLIVFSNEADDSIPGECDSVCRSCA